ncbi:hypothetical protein M9Y10_030501 [Tritrichomonas musculus]|uniref:Dual OB-containing domain-containing protein n=1 Tax=Tritrichomonas musculus TaxID=1915356 RepID=A0ABR2H3D3_9EUKA
MSTRNILTGVVVAKSRKNNGICLVIWDLEKRKSYRIISEEIRKDHELFEEECVTEKGEPLDIFDKIEVCVINMIPQNDEYQKENYILDKKQKNPIHFISNMTFKEFLDLYEKDSLTERETIFSNSSQTLDPQEAKICENSFILAHVSNLRIYEVGSRFYNKTKVRCSFDYKEIHYTDFYVTICKTADDDLDKYGGKLYKNAVVGFSFGHPFKNKCYKFLCSFLGELDKNQ